MELLEQFRNGSFKGYHADMDSDNMDTNENKNDMNENGSANDTDIHMSEASNVNDSNLEID